VTRKKKRLTDPRLTLPAVIQQDSSYSTIEDRASFSSLKMNRCFNLYGLVCLICSTGTQIVRVGGLINCNNLGKTSFAERSHLFAGPGLPVGQDAGRPRACLVGTSSQDKDFPSLQRALELKGFDSVQVEGEEEQSEETYRYKFQKATGMLQLIGGGTSSSTLDVPKWVPIVSDMEKVLISNGWSFLDPDENEPMSAFDIDAANSEGTYRPQWSSATSDSSTLQADLTILSSLGFDITQMSLEAVLKAADSTIMMSNEQTRSCLLKGATDPPNIKRTHNGIEFTGPTGQSDLPRGIFVCAIGGLPLFSSMDVSPTTASSGWLSFSKPLSSDHVVLVTPDCDTMDQRIEVVCAKSKCHLGHFFGQGEGYCINASGLNFIPNDRPGATEEVTTTQSGISNPISWRALESKADLEPRHKLLREVLCRRIPTEKIVLGAGCFWHVEAALRRLPGVVHTAAGYAGGRTSHPNYEHVCHEETGHAEVVLVESDPSVLGLRILIDSFLALHDPTKIRAHGKHAQGTGQYRSCVFVQNSQAAQIAKEAIEDCQTQLQKDLSTALVCVMEERLDDWFWKAEDRHQKHEERRNDKKAEIATLTLNEWLAKYGKREKPIFGSAQTINQTVEAL
jgi:peptide-methionine (S)-S-oxide reductase